MEHLTFSDDRVKFVSFSLTTKRIFIYPIAKNIEDLSHMYIKQMVEWIELGKGVEGVNFSLTHDELVTIHSTYKVAEMEELLCD